jgi:hypothetical protein
MKKVNKLSRAESPYSDPADYFELLPHYDLRKMKPGKPIRRFEEGEEVMINGELHIVRGRSFVPAPAPAVIREERK